MVETVSKPTPACCEIFKAVQLLSEVSSAHYGDPLYNMFAKNLAAFSWAQHKEAHKMLKSTKITDFFNSAETDMGGDVETDITMEVNRSETSESEGSVSIELLSTPLLQNCEEQGATLKMKIGGQYFLLLLKHMLILFV